MNDMNALVEKYHQRAVFSFIYIMEAHAVDEWPVRCEYQDIKQHTSMVERAEAAKLLQDEFPLHPHMHLVLDNIQNHFNTAYASWPFRYWVVLNGRIELKLMPEGDQVSMTHLEQWCARNLQ